LCNNQKQYDYGYGSLKTFTVAQILLTVWSEVRQYVKRAIEVIEVEKALSCRKKGFFIH